MSSRKNFLPKHPKIVKVSPHVTEESISRIGLGCSRNSSVERQQEIMVWLKNKEKKQIEKLRQKAKELQNKNNIIEQALRYYNNQTQKEQLKQMIAKAKEQIEETELKIKNCAKVEESTTPEQYYLWQKKKRMAQFNKKLNLVTSQNQQEREELKQIVEKFKSKIAATRQEIQYVLHEIQKIQSEFVVESFSDLEGVDIQKINSLKQEHETLMYTINMLRQNNEILTSQLEQSMENTQVSLRRSFESTKNTLIREVQLIKKQIQNSQNPQSHKVKGKQQTPIECMQQYSLKLKEVEDLLTSQQAQEAQKLVKPFDWLAIKWQMYLQNPQHEKNIDYIQKYQTVAKEHDQLQKEIQKAEKEIQDAVTQNVRMTQENLEIEAAANKLLKLFPSKK